MTITRGDYAEAVAKWRPLAEQGAASAQYGLGMLYASGRGVPQDYKEAATWFRKAAEQGYVRAQKKMGRLLLLGGYGLPPDPKVAMTWIRKAAEQGDNESQNILGFMYDTGKGVQQDRVQAYMWYSIASADGYEHGTRNLGKIAKEMTPAQIDEAQKLAREWLEKP